MNDFEEACKRLTDSALREDGAFNDSGLPNDEVWLRFGRPLFADIDTIIAEARRLRKLLPIEP